MSEPVVAIVVAAGSGSRLGTSAAGGSGPKALRLLGGEPLVRRSVRAMFAGGAERCVVVIPDGPRQAFQEALTDLPGPVTLTAGGATRQQSVYQGLAAIDFRLRCRIILVHDAARPLVAPAVVRRVIEVVAEGAEAVVPVVPVIDTIRRLDGDTSDVVDRAALRAVQTPQGFRARALLEAHELAASHEYTDDAAVAAAAGHQVTLVAGERRNIKITEPEDFAVGEALLSLGEEPA